MLHVGEILARILSSFFQVPTLSHKNTLEQHGADCRIQAVEIFNFLKAEFLYEMALMPKSGVINKISQLQKNRQHECQKILIKKICLETNL